MRKFFRKTSLLLLLSLSFTGVIQPYSQIQVYADETSNSLSELTAPSKAYLYNFTDASAGYQVIFSDKNDYTGITGASLSYRVYIDNNYVASVSASKKYISASVVNSLNLSSNTYHRFKMDISATWSDGTTTTSPYSDSTTFYYASPTAGYDTGIGSVYITTSRDSSNEYIDLYTDTSKTKVNAAITVKGTDGSVSTNNFGTINVRGNSTALAAKKPYNIKFDSKQNLFGMGKAKKWSLLANIFDKTLLRNKIGLDFQRGLENSRTAGYVYTSMCQPVDLYLDGKYVGNYLLTESVQTGDTRVNIDESYIDENDDATEGSGKVVTINGTSYTVYDALLELANDVKDIPSRYDEESYYFRTNSYNEYFAINSPERTNTSYAYRVNEQNKPQWVKDDNAFVNAFESVLSSYSYDAATKFNLLSQFIDIDSFVDFYITSEYFMTKDINFSSTRFYIKNGKIYGGPLWDLDLSSGNIVDHPGYTDFYAQGYAWFGALMNNSYFKDAVKSRFTELQPTIKNLYSDGGVVDKEYNNILQSANMNYSVAYNTNDYTGWHLSTNYGQWNSTTTYSTYITYINEYKNWLSNRNNWLRTQWNITDPVEAQISDSLEINGFQISDVAEGFRTLYSVEPTIDNKQVTQAGLIYGIEGYSTPNELTLNSACTYVHSFAATNAGIVSDLNFSTSGTSTCYAMTMLFAASTPQEFTANMYIRVYAVLSDGSVVYSPVESYSIYRVADYIYKNQLANRPSLHTYLYNILKVANPSYTQVDFRWPGYFVNPDEIGN